ncbi:helix-turn-helix domain-containing protein [Domibacillus mangrovi]|uniref:Helix-turn-helix domain-containing protein n=1 Tax=Domibacillus mangrovi TaxID=1714354 RepID=A0A1Q5NZ26_9BACI|nr:helix-turn-helix domain-containing protein [Domibacillus mangrovi]OKL35260.1 hypothetical protein BLL40_16415 [Domibacillus mangrovi]
MCEHKILTHNEFEKLQQYKPYAINHAEQQKTKLILFNPIKAAYGDKFYRLKKGTQQSIEMICWFGAEKGFCFASADYFAKRFNVTNKTIRNIFKQLRDYGLIYTVYRRSSIQNGLGAPIHLFVKHPYFRQWIKLLQLGHFQPDFHSENTEIPCESKNNESKKDSTKYLSFNKKILKNLRKKIRLDESFTPKNVPQRFIKAVSPFISDAKDIYVLWKKALITYGKSNLADPIEFYLDITIDAFKQTVFAHKQRIIKKDFNGYFYGTLMNMFIYQKRKESIISHPYLYNWLEDKDYDVIKQKNEKHKESTLINKNKYITIFKNEDIPY